MEIVSTVKKIAYSTNQFLPKITYYAKRFSVRIASVRIHFFRALTHTAWSFRAVGAMMPTSPKKSEETHRKNFCKKFGCYIEKVLFL